MLLVADAMCAVEASFRCWYDEKIPESRLGDLPASALKHPQVYKIFNSFLFDMEKNEAVLASMLACRASCVLVSLYGLV